jgi:hypothetical protein
MDVGLVVGVVGVVASVIGIPVAVYLARRGRQKPELRVCPDFQELLSPDEGVPRESLSVTYAGRPVERVSRTILAMWSARGDTVRGSDIVPSDPLRIEVSDGDELLQVQAIACSRAPCSFEVQLRDGDDFATVSFDFMDPGDGIVLEVLHAGETPAQLLGTMRGATVHTRSSGDLDKRRLELFAEPSRIKRWRERSRENKVTREAEGGPGRIGYALWIAASVGAFLTAPIFGLAVDVRRARSARLIDTSKYDLTSLAGQGKFAHQVTHHGFPIHSTFVLDFVFLAGAISLLCAVAVWRFLSVTRVFLPASVVQLRGPEALSAVRHSKDQAATADRAPRGETLNP